MSRRPGISERERYEISTPSISAFVGCGSRSPSRLTDCTGASLSTRPVRVIIGYPPGGSADITARLISQWLTERLGQSFVVESRPGAPLQQWTRRPATRTAEAGTRRAEVNTRTRNDGSRRTALSDRRRLSSFCLFVGSSDFSAAQSPKSRWPSFLPGAVPVRRD